MSDPLKNFRSQKYPLVENHRYFKSPDPKYLQWTSDPGPDPSPKISVIQKILRLNATKSDQILDTYCDNGLISHYLSKKGYDLTGCDIAKRVKIAQDLGQIYESSARFISGDYTSLLGIGFDWVILDRIPDNLDSLKVNKGLIIGDRIMEGEANKFYQDTSGRWWTVVYCAKKKLSEDNQISASPLVRCPIVPDRNIFMFWTQKVETPKPWLIQIFHQRASQLQGFHLVTPDNIWDYLKPCDLPNGWDLLIPAHQADIIRIALLFRHGGIWLDSDTLVRPHGIDSNLSKYYGYLKTGLGFWLQEEPDLIVNCIIGSRHNTPLLKKYHARQLEIASLDSKFHHWTIFGSQLIQELRQDTQLWKGYQILPAYQTCYSIPWRQCNQILLDKDWSIKQAQKYGADPDLLVTVNSLYQEVTKDTPLTDTLLEYFLKPKIEYKGKYLIQADWIPDYLAVEHAHFDNLMQDAGWTIIPLSQWEARMSGIEVPSRLLFHTYDDYLIPTSLGDHQIIFRLDDVYPEKERKVNCQRADLVLATYPYKIPQDWKLRDRKVYRLDYSIPEYCLRDTIVDIPRTELLVSGSLGTGSLPYSLRRYASRIADHRIVKLPHPGYGAGSGGLKGPQYTQFISNYLVHLADASDYGYVLLKVFETLGSGAMLLADRLVQEQLKDLGIIDGYTCILASHSDLPAKIEWCLDPSNLEKVNWIRNNGFILAKSHTTEVRVRHLLSFLSSWA